jgi:hypothetical protein
VDPVSDAYSRAQSQLAEIMGDANAQSLISDCLGESGLTKVNNADELLAFSLNLIARGGFVEVVGRSLKVVALLSGARPA